MTNCPYETIYSKHNICSYEFLLQFHDSFAGRLRNRTTWLWKIDTWFLSSLTLHNTTEIIIIIKWNVLFVEKNIFGDFFDGSRISDRRHVNTTENAMSSTDIFISNRFDVCQWSNISKTMLLWNGLLILFVLLAGFPWNMARPQLHLLSLTVKKLWCQASYFTFRSPKPPI